MRAWPVQDAKARFSEMLETCLKDGPQLVTKRGADAAVLVPVEEWNRVKDKSNLSLKEILLSPLGKSDLDIPVRKKLNHRKLPVF